MKILNLLILIALSITYINGNVELNRDIPLNCTRERDEAHGSSVPQKIKKTKCLEPKFFNETSFEEIMNVLKSKSPKEINDEELIENLFMSEQAMLSTQNSIIILTKINYGNYLENALHSLKRFLWIYSENLYFIVKQVRNLHERKVYVESLFSELLDHN